MNEKTEPEEALDHDTDAKPSDAPAEADAPSEPATVEDQAADLQRQCDDLEAKYLRAAADLSPIKEEVHEGTSRNIDGHHGRARSEPGGTGVRRVV